MSYDFPEYNNLNINYLSGIFNNTSASYKFVYFLAILNLIKENPENRELTYKDIELEMIYIGWFPHTFYKLNFGYNDQLGTVIEKVSKKIGDININSKNKREGKSLIAEKINPLDSTLLDMVPYRLLSTFVDDSSITKSNNKHVVNWANSLRDDPRVLYSFKNDKDSKVDNSITISNTWFNYIKSNYRILKDFATYNFLKYMERRNPNVLNLSTKLFPPSRESCNLKYSKDFWLPIIEENKLQCIYSGYNLTSKNISIDHYLPWSFVAHNREWNLIPTTINVNSSKSNSLPDIRYYDNFIQYQHLALNSLKEINSKKNYLENYFVDLRLKPTNLNLNNIKSAYNNILNPLFSMAKNQGFNSNWTWSY